MRTSSAFGMTLIVGTSMFGQISDEEAVARARAYVSTIGVEPRQREPIVYPHPYYGDRIIVSLDGFVSVRMNLDGSFVMFSNGRRKPPESGSGHFRNDEEAWQRAERIIARLDPPDGLLRESIRRMDESTGEIYCDFDVRPYGYWSEVGNCASVSFQASDGAVLGVIVDTVTGEVVAALRAMRAGASAQTPSSGTTPRRTDPHDDQPVPGSDSESAPAASANSAAFVVLTVVGLAVLAWVGRKLILRP